jgi:two-component system, OmpR family, response regulator
MDAVPASEGIMGQPAASAARRSVLVADDDRTTRFAISATLRRSGFDVHEAENGSDAVRQITHGAFDLVFLDIWMPGVNGLEVLKQIRESGANPKVIVMTSDNTPQTLLQAIREQAYAYVNKPFPPGQAVELAERALATEAQPIEVISAQPHWVELLIPCTRDAAERVQSFLGTLESSLPADLREVIGPAFRELLLNAVEWGGKLDPNRKVRIASVRSPHIIIYRIADPGPGFDPDKLEHAAIAHPDDPMIHDKIREQMGIRPGGFGLMMTRAMADELIYNEARNEVIFIKYIHN